ncbi:MAG: CotS family spore coat protein [Lachnospiraceae bacterium]|nr:CotS family spore coat protein [Lachnospiraceae bacterium]
MNDKAVSVLENYDMEVIRTFKGRGTIICDTTKGLRVLKEYNGSTEKLELLELLQEKVSHIVRTDMIVRNKEGELFCKDSDGITYIVKEQIEGRECNYKNEEEILQAFRAMAKLHQTMRDNSDMAGSMPIHYYVEEMEKHTKECRRVRNYLRRLKIKTDFERALLQEYNYFMERAEDIMQKAMEEDREEYENFVRTNGFFCHGDYQYHNVIFVKNDIAVINLERFAPDSGVRDFYLLFRKISEKSDWSLALGEKMLAAYESNRSFTPMERKQLYYRLAYPDKFWKIVNFYYNSKKSWIPDKNMEKLENLVNQERAKEKLLKAIFA